MFDSPSTRALYDSSTRLLWAVDSFGSLFPGAVFERDDVPDDMFAASFDELNLGNTPWLSWADEARFAAHVAQSASLDTEVVASAHGPVLRGAQIADAYQRTLALVGRAPVEMPDQAFLEAFLAMMAAPAA
jgi:hypothetical protein